MDDERELDPRRLLKDMSSSWVNHRPSRPLSLSAPSSPLSRATNALIGVGAVLAGFVLALIFAATLAVALVMGAAALALTAVAWRLSGQRARAETRAVGHSWVAYSLERRV